MSCTWWESSKISTYPSKKNVHFDQKSRIKMFLNPKWKWSHTSYLSSKMLTRIKTGHKHIELIKISGACKYQIRMILLMICFADRFISHDIYNCKFMLYRVALFDQIDNKNIYNMIIFNVHLFISGSSISLISWLRHLVGDLQFNVK